MSEVAPWDEKTQQEVAPWEEAPPWGKEESAKPISRSDALQMILPQNMGESVKNPATGEIEKIGPYGRPMPLDMYNRIYDPEQHAFDVEMDRKRKASQMPTVSPIDVLSKAFNVYLGGPVAGERGLVATLSQKSAEAIYRDPSETTLLPTAKGVKESFKDFGDLFMSPFRGAYDAAVKDKG